jgi:predicted nucleic-acid-binding protein
MIILDTNSLIRFFTDDLPKEAARVEKLLKSEKNLTVPCVVLPEIEYVLMYNYYCKRPDIIQAYEFLLKQPNIHLSKEAQTAISLFIRENLDMADCLIIAEALCNQPYQKIASFDKKMNRIFKKLGGKPVW